MECRPPPAESANGGTSAQSGTPPAAAPAVAVSETLPGRGQEAAPGEVLSSDPEARALFLAGIQALETMARRRRETGSAG